MPFDPDKHHRRSIRLKEYDYSQFGVYFVTLCTQNRECLFGDIVDSNMHLNDIGRMLDLWWSKLEQKFAPSIEQGLYVIMPNHVHGIIVNPVGADPRVRPVSAATQLSNNDAATSYALGTIIQWFKTMTTNAYLKNARAGKWPPVNKRLWQRNYYEHIVRDEDEFVRIAEYIDNNPYHWATDENNPAAPPSKNDK